MSTKTKIPNSERSVEMRYLDPKKLIPYTKNAKRHPPEQISEIAGQIHAFGFDQPIVVDKEMVIIKGHGRTLAALQLGLKQVPVIVADWLSEYDAMAARIADNKVSEKHGGFDMDFLKFDLGTLKMHEFNLDLTAMNSFEIDSLLHEGEVGQEKTAEIGKSTSDKKEDYENSETRQIMLIYDDEQFEEVMPILDRLKKEFEVETNSEAVFELLKKYENDLS